MLHGIILFLVLASLLHSHHMDFGYSQASGLKGEVSTEQAAKRLKMCVPSDVAKLASPQSSDADVGMASPHTEAAADKNKQLVNPVSRSPKASTATRLQESTGLKHPIQPLMPVNRYKLDNRPAAFCIIPPLPSGLANVSILSVFLSPWLRYRRILQWHALLMHLFLIL